MVLAERRVKRLIDLVGSVVGLGVAAPLFAAIAAVVKLDSRGPVFFRQRRLGERGLEFSLIKFRTMKWGAAVALGADRTAANPVGDPRVTRVGRYLRVSSLDELPQLVNVLRGEMSLVGPRPDLPVARAMYTPRERVKLSVKPGITGLAQTSGRNSLSSAAKWELDARYAEQASLALDCRILVRTFIRVLAREGIYKESQT